MDITLEESAPEWVISDENHYSQVMLNVMANAVKFTHKGGVSINVKIIDEEGKVYIRTVIEDTGIGVKKEQLNTIFNEFTQANMSINREFGGTGLGLAITKKLVDALEGRINFESKYGAGSTVTIDVPYEKSHQKKYVTSIL